MGATGLPEGGLVTMIMVLRSANVPTSALVLLLPFDRILDRFRTMVNVWGSLVCATTVDYLASTRKHSAHVSPEVIYDDGLEDKNTQTALS